MELRGDGAIDYPVNEAAQFHQASGAGLKIHSEPENRRQKNSLVISEREILFLCHSDWAGRLTVPGRG